MTQNKNISSKDSTKNAKTKQVQRHKQIAAIIGIALLVLLYIITLIVAIVDTSLSGRLFQACLVASFAVPILIWIYIWMYGKLTNRHTFADFNTSSSDSESSEHTD